MEIDFYRLVSSETFKTKQADKNLFPFRGCLQPMFSKLRHGYANNDLANTRDATLAKRHMRMFFLLRYALAFANRIYSIHGNGK